MIADQEIRKRLIQLGYKTPPPVTATTRSILLRKLAQLESENGHLEAESQNVGNYDYVDSSDGAIKSKSLSPFMKGPPEDDPFEEGSDGDDATSSNERHTLSRKPLGLKRESEFFCSPRLSVGNREYEDDAAYTLNEDEGGKRSIEGDAKSRVSFARLALAFCLVFLGGIYLAKNGRREDIGVLASMSSGAFDYVFYVGITIAVLFSTHMVIRWGVNRRRAKVVDTQNLIKGVLEILQQNAVANPAQSYLPIVHVRDLLIACDDRKSKIKIWDEVVKYIEGNESRIRREIQPYQGEDYDVWRWVGGRV